MDMPFDKLPKFLAIAGLSLAAGGATLLYSTYFDRAKEQLKLVDIYVQYNTKKQSTAAALPPAPEGPECKEAGKPITKECQLMLEKAEPIQDAWLDAWLSMTKVEAADAEAQKEAIAAFGERFAAQDKIYTLQFILGSFGVMIGALISGYGFKGWRDLELKDRDVKTAAG